MSAIRVLGRRLHRFLRMPPREILTTIHVVVLLSLVEVLIRWVPLPRLSRLLGLRLNLDPARPDIEEMAWTELSPRARRQIRCTRRVADVWPLSRGPCLRRSLVAGHLLRRHHPAVRLGVATAGDTVLAHAWLEIDDRPLESVVRLQRVPTDTDRDECVSGPPPLIYEQCGVRLRSEVELHLPISSGDAFDVDVRWGEDIHDSSEPPPGDVIAMYGSDEDRWYTATSTGTDFRMRFREVGEFVISADLSTVEIRRDPAGRTEILPILMAGTVSAFLLALRGETVLHASAVAIDGAALAFVGQSGRGKSTLAALLCVEIAGIELVTDDVLTVDPGPPVTCLGGAFELRLRPAAAVLADARPGSPTRPTADERLAFAPTSRPPDAAAARRDRHPWTLPNGIGRRGPSHPPEQGLVRAAVVSTRPWLVPAGRAQPRLHDTEPGRQPGSGVRRDDPVGPTVQPERRPLTCRADLRRVPRLTRSLI